MRGPQVPEPAVGSIKGCEGTASQGSPRTKALHTCKAAYKLRCRGEVVRPIPKPRQSSLHFPSKNRMHLMLYLGASPVIHRCISCWTSVHPPIHYRNSKCSPKGAQERMERIKDPFSLLYRFTTSKTLILFSLSALSAPLTLFITFNRIKTRIGILIVLVLRK